MVIGLFVTVILTPSCSKNTDCVAVVHVIDTAGNPVAGATVVLFKTNVTQYNGVTANVTQTQVSDGSGTCTYTFALPAVLDITAKTTTKSGKGEISLQVGQTTEQTVRVY
ncbi:MAG TPA: hypothetical protein VK890_09395 [Bacteroidia bacterium]|jgi:hypothetical protein|nr:hypothetical protein [Bacteroidia bacterium]